MAAGACYRMQHVCYTLYVALTVTSSDACCANRREKLASPQPLWQ